MNATVVKKTRKISETASPKAKSPSSGKQTAAKSVANNGLNKISGKSAVKSVTAKKTASAASRSATKKAAEQKPSKSAVIAKSSGTSKRPAVNKAAKSIAKAPATLASASSKTEKPVPRKSTKSAPERLSPSVDTALDSKVSEVATKTSKPNPDTPAQGSLLTEEQILKMDEKDYMNEAQLAFFKARLQQLERDLLKNADETTEHLRETVLVPDPADRATIEEEHALELRTRDRERKLLKKVQQSLAAIESGDYGWCEETGDPIGIPRLLARPTATLSLEAQQRRELKQKLYGD
ncbi:TraR/DksA family transcriptional regulator [Paucimonas lemoignei]|uniref:RNA polymerase-binding transcription factor DksA n=1 Tax=Paucimonas lemoignei TaxID=29443 RepID=A0A4V2UIW8_PAULE|nr:RNA polymerase-binding protein DksA [Paucimonas lemoignei]TCS37780.1 TraR/DksA family transcriptional regulator [Paucimonas lemoignei]